MSDTYLDRQLQPNTIGTQARVQSISPVVSCIIESPEMDCDSITIWTASDTRAAPRAEASSRDSLYSEFAPLVRRLLRQYAFDDPELRQDLHGEIYWRFSVFHSEYDPAVGVPLRPYLVRRLSASVYSYVRQRWRSRPREVSLDAVLAGIGDALETVSRRSSDAASGCPVAGSLSCTLLAGWSHDPTSAWDEAIIAWHLAGRLPDLIAGLPTRQRQVVVYHYYEHRSFEEIAGIMGVRPATARSLLRHGLRKLRNALQPAPQAILEPV
jgi:RNA polymerase sigma factor (sigma-70 family)